MLLWQIAKKDLLTSFRDKSSWFILLLMPLVLIIILSVVFGGIDTNPSFFPAQVALVNLDQPETNIYSLNLGQQFVNFLYSEEMQEMLEIIPAVSRNEAEQLIKDGKVTTAIIIPANFTAAWQNGANADIQLLGDAGSTMIPHIVEAIVESYITILEANRIQFNAVTSVLNEFQFGRAVLDQVMTVLIQHGTVRDLPLTFKELLKEGKTKVSLKSYFSAGTAVMFLLFAGNAGIFSILEERERKTLLRLKTSQITKFSFILGKFLAVLLIGLIQFTSLIFFTCVVLKVNWGNSITGLCFLTSAGVTSTAALSVLIAAITKSAKTANAVNWIAIQLLAFLGGSYLPISSMPPILQFFSKFTVNGQAMQGYLKLMSGGEFTDVLGTGLLLFFSGAIFITLSSFFLKFGEDVV